MKENQANTFEKEVFKRSLMSVENTCNSLGVNHRFVGGAISDLLSPETRIKIDVPQKTVFFSDYPQLTLTRSDGTVKDLDIILFTQNRQHYKQIVNTFSEWSQLAKENGMTLPTFSAEAAGYPGWPKINALKQFVTAWEVDENNIPSLNFGSIKQPIRPETIEPWFYYLEDDDVQITGLNPFGFSLCYLLRVPSGVKKKDKTPSKCTGKNGQTLDKKYSKMFLVMSLAQKVNKEATNEGYDLKEAHQEWVSYIRRLRTTTDPLIRAKSFITDTYWNTVGTYIAHRSNGSMLNGH